MKPRLTTKGAVLPFATGKSQTNTPNAMVTKEQHGIYAKCRELSLMTNKEIKHIA
ncbi:hypothetical protein [Vibrio owensii]|uniref:hypothetical protein n=1 Tax=Vibrio owensii TaxID=696485 RepID=UPI0022DE3207|nr:hypothetical protein [Vibrio owensii]